MNNCRELRPARSIDLGSGYAASAVNTVLSRAHGILTRGNCQYGAYYESAHRIALFRRDLRTESLQRGQLEGCYNVADCHNGIGLGIDADGFVHLAYDHHAQPLQHRRSLQPCSVESWSEPMPMTGQCESRVTYPYFVMMPRDGQDREGMGRLLFLYRHGVSGNGDMCLKEYDPSRRKWEDIAERFVKGTEQAPWTCNAYWDHPSFDSRGRLVLSWVWRTNWPQGIRTDNHNYCYAQSPDGRRWFSSQGVEFALPMTPVNSEVVWTTSPRCCLANMCGSAVDSHDRLHVVTYAADRCGGIPQYKHLWQDGSSWRCDTLSRRADAFNLDNDYGPISVPDVVVDRQDRLYVLFGGDLTGYRLSVQRLDPPDYAPPGHQAVLWNEPLQDSEIVVDRIRWRRDEVLSMLIQRDTEQRIIGGKDVPDETVRVVEWELGGWAETLDRGEAKAW